MGKRGRRASESAIDQERLKYSFMFRMRVADGVFSILKVVSFGVPLYFVWKVFGTFGGQTTTFSVSLITRVSVVVSVASVATVILAWAKMRKQKDELVRCRERISELEEHASKKPNSEKEQ